MLGYFTAAKDVAPWVAMVFSIAALALSFFNYRRDRAIVKATSSFTLDWEGFNGGVRVNIVNAGRRPIILREWVGAETKPSRFGGREIVEWASEYFEEGKGIVLTEGQTHSFRLDLSDLVKTLPNDVVVVMDDVWINDTLGRRHNIKKSRDNVDCFWAWRNNKSKMRFTASPPAPG
jgi:hypothetical protein